MQYNTNFIVFLKEVFRHKFTWITRSQFKKSINLLIKGQEYSVPIVLAEIFD